mgnify:CR=1 FL=1
MAGERVDAFAVKRAVERPNGLILVSGPPGSGKRTTIYSCLNHLNAPQKMLLSIESLIKYEVPGMVQVKHDDKSEYKLAEGVRGQGRRIVEALLSPPPVPFVQVVPNGTALRGFYLTPTGDAVVDLSGDATAKHPGGTTAELLTVYSIVNTVTTNLPSVKRVQIVVDGEEVDTLAGHVDLRQPLEPDLSLIRDARRTSR